MCQDASLILRTVNMVDEWLQLWIFSTLGSTRKGSHGSMVASCQAGYLSISICTYIYIYTHTYIYVRMYIHICIYIYIYIYTHAHAYLYVHLVLSYTVLLNIRKDTLASNPRIVCFFVSWIFTWPTCTHELVIRACVLLEMSSWWFKSTPLCIAYIHILVG